MKIYSIINDNYYNIVLRNEKYCNNNIKVDPIMVNTRILGHRCVANDRFGYLNKFSDINYKIKSDESIPTFTESNVDFNDAMDNSFKKCLYKLKEKNLLPCISWSGGVDSTAVLTWFLENYKETDKLKILYNKKSIEEYPYFYNNIILKKIKKENLIYSTLDTIENDVITHLKDSLIIHANCCDQLFGSVINVEHPDLFNLDWKIGIYKLLNSYGFNNFIKSKKLNDFYEIMENYFSYFPLKIEQFCEYIWFISFAMKWLYVKYFIQTMLSQNELENNFYCFFDTLNFQTYSLYNYEKIRYNPQINPKNYKIPVKKITLEYTKDKNYFENKGKASSVLKTLTTKKNNSYVYTYTDKGFKKYKVFTDKFVNYIHKLFLKEGKELYI